MEDITAKSEPVARNSVSQGSAEKAPIDAPLQPDQSWATRNGLNLKSFTPHDDLGTGTVELERTMKPRHLNMIAIGGRSVLFTLEGSRCAALGLNVRPREPSLTMIRQ
jgi:amino acid permease